MSNEDFPHAERTAELAKYIKETNSDMQVRVWTVSNRSRVYVTQSLSRGRHREIGFVEINDSGETSYEANYIRATVRD